MAATGKSLDLLATEALHLQRFKDLLKENSVVPPVTMMPAGDLDATLCRYLRARKWDVQKAYDMITATIRWRADNDVDSYLTRRLSPEAEAAVRRNKQDGNLGRDKKGRPIYVERSASTNLAGLAAVGVSVDDFVFTQIRLMEYLVRVLFKDASADAGRVIDGNVAISDFQGAGLGLLSPANTKLFQRMSSIYSDHYPEMMARCLVVNAPTVISVIYKALSVFMDPGTREKVKFAGPKDLLEEIDASVLPVEYGGTRSAEKGGFLTDTEGYVPECWLEMDRRIEALRQQEAATAEKAPSTAISITAAAALPTVA